MDNLNVELIASIVGGVAIALTIAIVAYLTTKNLASAALKLAEELGKQKAMLDAIETEYLKLPESTRALITAAVTKAIEIAETTETPLDDAFLEVLRKMTDGLPNVWRTPSA